MSKFKRRYILDEDGLRIGVLLDIREYEILVEELEELDAIQAYMTAKASRDKAIPIEEAIAEIEKVR
jgi:hypothetical protein